MENTFDLLREDNVSSLLFRVRTRLCALPLAQVIETMRPLPIEQISCGSTGINGITIVRGEPLPVVELAAVLGNVAVTPTRFVKVKSGKKHIVLAVDSVHGVRTIPIGTLRNMPAILTDADDDTVAAIGTLDAELVLLLNAARLVSDDTWSELNAIGAET